MDRKAKVSYEPGRLLSSQACALMNLTPYRKSGRLDLNQRPLRPERSGDDSQPVTQQDFSILVSAVCTRVCTSEEESVHESIESLAAELRQTLRPDQCRRLAELLVQEGNARGGHFITK